MKFFYPLCLTAALTVSVAANAQQAMLSAVGMAKSQAAKTAEARTILSEDFAKFIAGSEDTPDATNIANLRTGAISASYTTLPGWTGAAIYQAGGVCAITTGMYSGDDGAYEDTGFLRTPMGDYAGDVTVTFRARLLDATDGSDVMAVILNSTSGRLEASTVTVTPEWQNFKVSFSKGLFADCLVEMSMLKAKVLVDDIVITSVQTSIPAPAVLGASAFVNDGFTANWAATDEADKYLLSVYERDAKAATTLVDFENLNLVDDKHINVANPGLPEGWTFSYGHDADSHISNLGFEGSTGIVLGGTGDGFETPLFDRDIRDFMFYAAHPSGEECLSNTTFSCLVNGTWVSIGNIAIERIAKDGEIINLSSKLPAGTRQIQMIVKKNDVYDAERDIKVVLDHIKVMTEPDATPVFTDREVTGTSAEVRELDPEKDYSYTVKAANSEFTSAESAHAMAAGLAVPALLAAGHITDNSYTAQWSSVPKAEGYMVTNYSVYTAPEDVETVVLSENFDKVTEGTLTAPVGLYNSFSPKSLDQYTSTPGWLGLCNYLVEGMMGTRSFFTAKGSIQTPTMNLSANGGKFLVRIRIYADTDAVGDMLVVQAGSEVYQRKDITEASVPLDYVFEFDNGDANMALLIYSYMGKPFYIDEISVIQMLEKGQQTITEVETKNVAGGESTSVTFDGLSAKPDENYAYRVFAYRDFYGDRVYSLSDELKHVSSLNAVGDAIADGSQLKAYAHGLNLIVTSDAPQHISVYGIDAVKVADTYVNAGTTTIQLPSRGLYLVTSDCGYTAKILAR